jgi:hypothetical protein
MRKILRLKHIKVLPNINFLYNLDFCTYPELLFLKAFFHKKVIAKHDFLENDDVKYFICTVLFILTINARSLSSTYQGSR